MHREWVRNAQGMDKECTGNGYALLLVDEESWRPLFEQGKHFLPLSNEQDEI